MCFDNNCCCWVLVFSLSIFGQMYEFGDVFQSKFANIFLVIRQFTSNLVICIMASMTFVLKRKILLMFLLTLTKLAICLQSSLPKF